jgi:hypothetical protein
LFRWVTRCAKGFLVGVEDRDRDTPTLLNLFRAIRLRATQFPFASRIVIERPYLF